jgi:hypothetical protein
MRRLADLYCQATGRKDPDAGELVGWAMKQGLLPFATPSAEETEKAIRRLAEQAEANDN